MPSSYTTRIRLEKQIEVENTEAISETSFNELSEEEKQKRAQARLNVLSELSEEELDAKIHGKEH